MDVEFKIGENERKELSEIVKAAVIAGLNELQKKNEGGGLFTLEQAAGRLNVHRTTIWKWAKDGVLHTHRIGGRVYVKESDIINLTN